jgi:hypothetical protein
MQQLATVFNRRFNNIASHKNNQDRFWLNSSSLALEKILSYLIS